MMAELTPAERREQRIAEAKRRIAEKRGETLAPGSEGASTGQPSVPAVNQEATLGSAVQEDDALAQEEPEVGITAGETEEVAAVGDESQSVRENTEPVAASVPVPAENKTEASPTVATSAETAASSTTLDNEPEAEPTLLRTEIRTLNRREFLTYSWGAAVGIVSAQSLVATGLLMYPRFRAGEFGGDFAIGSVASLPSMDSAPEGDPIGKFWLVNTEEGPQALYMVCTHLGCLYKWVEANRRFECPCHGSKFTREGIYIEGPAPRGLDHFVVELQENGTVVGSTESLDGLVQPPAPTSDNLEIVVKTGSKILGKSNS